MLDMTGLHDPFLNRISISPKCQKPKPAGKIGSFWTQSVQSLSRSSSNGFFNVFLYNDRKQSHPRHERSFFPERAPAMMAPLKNSVTRWSKSQCQAKVQPDEVQWFSVPLKQPFFRADYAPVVFSAHERPRSNASDEKQKRTPQPLVFPYCNYFMNKMTH